MSQYNKLSNIQYARFHILHVDLHFETVLVSWYPHHALKLKGNTSNYNFSSNIVKYNILLESSWFYMFYYMTIIFTRMILLITLLITAIANPYDLTL